MYFALSISNGITMNTTYYHWFIYKKGVKELWNAGFGPHLAGGQDWKFLEKIYHWWKEVVFF